MAEVVAVLGMANAGFKLSITLFAFAEAIGSADKEIVRTAREINLFSQVLKFLALSLERGRKTGSISQSAFETSAEIIEECRSLFDELDAMIVKSTSTKKVVKMQGDAMIAMDREKMVVPFSQRFLYLFRKSKVDTLRRNLESLKTSLQVMLSVLNYVEHLASFGPRYLQSNILLNLEEPGR